MKVSRRALEHALRHGAMDAAEPITVSNQGELHRFEFEGRPLAIKTVTGRGARGRVSQITLKREARAYERLLGVDGIPRCHGLIDDRWLVLDWVDGQPFREANPGPAFFDRLLAMLRAIHERGVSHGDLKRKANLMVDPEGQPWLIDFGAAWLLRKGWHPLNQWLFRLICQTDLNAWVKLKHGGYENVPSPDRELLQPTRIERILRRLRRY